MLGLRFGQHSTPKAGRHKTTLGTRWALLWVQLGPLPSPLFLGAGRELIMETGTLTFLYFSKTICLNNNDLLRAK